MDEQRLGELFREAVGEPPPPSFSRAEVVAASRRATARRRGAVGGATLLGVVALTAGLVGTDTLGTDVPAAAGGHGQSSAHPPPRAGANVAPGLPHTLGTAPGSAMPTPRAGVEPPRCAPPDDTLVTEVTAVLAEHGSAVVGSAGEVPAPCPAGSRTASVRVPGATLYVLVAPQGDASDRIDPQRRDQTRPDGGREHALTLDDGRVLVLISVPAGPGQPDPLGHDVPELAEQLAKRL